ncbi:SUKH-3 domain-containing protein [Streptomyces sp. NPDC046979]|uniref:SUKH-3 domain-containing protein n=1 Tax=Streptomyces sp. NPDC046979 TaxID=3154604 RepID=UPI003403C3F7
MTRRWSPRTDTVLRTAGWRPGRAVPTATWESILRERGDFAPHDAARRFLAEFGGLVTHGWPADTIATSSAIGFELHDAARRFLAEFGALRVPHREPWAEMPWREFSLDPLLAFWDTEIIEDLSDRAGVALYPIGMRDRRNAHLTMAEDGAVYEGMDDVWLLASTPDQALEQITKRIRSGPR